MAIKFKSGVPRDVLSVQMQTGLEDLEILFKSLGLDIWVTSTSDGKHMRTSKHYDNPCNAIDVRIWNILERFCKIMREVLGKDFDVVLEKDHIHVEYDPK